jgi:hypothetical protein
LGASAIISKWDPEELQQFVRALKPKFPAIRKRGLSTLDEGSSDVHDVTQ